MAAWLHPLQALFYGGTRQATLADRVIDCGGKIIAPGLIDLQVHLLCRHACSACTLSRPHGPCPS